MVIKVNSAIRALLVAAIAGFGASPAVAIDDITAASDGKTKINLSGRQRMLSQRMAKAACFASLDVQTEQHLTMLGDAHGLFERTLTGLSSGDVEQGLLPESNPDILQGLNRVRQMWEPFRSANETILGTNSVDADALGEIASVNGAVLTNMHETVGIIETVYGSSGTVHPALALALNVSGRQRMLTQKASKEFCLVVAGYDVETNRANLQQTVSLFSTSLNGLIYGDPANALAAAPTPQIMEQLQKVQEMWTPLEAILLSTANGNTPSAADIEKIATDNNPLLVEMNAAVFMYNNL